MLDQALLASEHRLAVWSLRTSRTSCGKRAQRRVVITMMRRFTLRDNLGLAITFSVSKPKRSRTEVSGYRARSVCVNDSNAQVRRP